MACERVADGERLGVRRVGDAMRATTDGTRRSRDQPRCRAPAHAGAVDSGRALAAPLTPCLSTATAGTPAASILLDAGHYESYFQRANHPTRPLAWWIRYTVFCPKGRARAGPRRSASCGRSGSDGERGNIAAAKQVVPWERCAFARDRLDVRVGGATLDDRGLRGAAVGAAHAFAWGLTYEGSRPPLLLLPANLYAGGFPKAKSLVGSPNAAFTGTISVDRRGARDRRGGSAASRHNWGARRTDRYAWGPGRRLRRRAGRSSSARRRGSSSGRCGRRR